MPHDAQSGSPLQPPQLLELQAVLSLQPLSWQSSHALPLPPHAVLLFPVAHMLLEVSQHPVLHPVKGVLPVQPVTQQLVPHTCVVVLQASFTAQSVATLHPQAPATHAVPLAFPVQSVQFAPEPHAVPIVPIVHMLVVVSQHPP